MFYEMNYNQAVAQVFVNDLKIPWGSIYTQLR